MFKLITHVCASDRAQPESRLPNYKNTYRHKEKQHYIPVYLDTDSCPKTYIYTNRHVKPINQSTLSYASQQSVGPVVFID